MKIQKKKVNKDDAKVETKEVSSFLFFFLSFIFFAKKRIKK